MNTFTTLTQEEKDIIEEKGTEYPFSGEYDKLFQEGTYLCRRCRTPLYRSNDKFRSECGWPSFDAEIPGRVHRALDEDGRRVEITCSTCFAHLGHVFEGEQLTEKDTRHCVNSLSLKFVPEVVEDSPWEIAVVGGGCFWCLEAAFTELRGVVAVYSGYAGGKRKNPSYAQVSTGGTGHVEVVQVVFDPEVITYEILLQVFFSIHDPTTLNRQGNDVGTQYASVIIPQNERQEELAKKIIKDLDDAHIWPDPLVTRVLPMTTFWLAEDYHQRYMERNSTMPYCQVVISPKLKKLREGWTAYLKNTLQ